MLLEKTQVIKEGWNYLTIREYLEQYHPDLSHQSIRYHLTPNKDVFDYFMLGKSKMIVINDKAKNYKPNENKNR